MPVTVEPLTTSLRRQKPIPWVKLDLTVRFNQVGAFSLLCPASDDIWKLISYDTDGTLKPFALLVDWNGVIRVPLLAEQINPTRTLDETGQVSDMLTISGADMFALLANRTVYKDATVAWSAQTIGSTTISGKAETAIKQVAGANLVTAGDTNRRVPNFTVATDLARGGSVSYTIVVRDPAVTTVSKTTTLADSVLDMIRAVARQTSIGTRIDLVGTSLVFDCYVPRDLTQRAVFSPRLGNLRAWNITDATPTNNAVLVQSGATSGAFSEAAGSGALDPWRRVENYADQTSTTDAAQLAQAKLDELAKGASATKLALTTTDIPRLRFGSDATGVQGYGLGDLVAAELRDGVVYTDLVSAVQLVADSTSGSYTETVTPTIGATDDVGDDPTATAQLAARVRAVERALRNRH